MKNIKIMFSYQDFKNKPVLDFLLGPDNIGNIVYLDLLIKHFNLETVSEEEIFFNPAESRKKCDILILPFSNMFSPYFSATKLIDILEFYQFNVVLLSVGIQAEDSADLSMFEISKDAYRLAALSAKKGFVIGARGNDTSALLSRLGFKHRVVGCPSALVEFSKRMEKPHFIEGEAFAINSTLTGDNRDKCSGIIKTFASNRSAIYFLQSEARIIADIFNIKTEEILSQRNSDSDYFEAFRNKKYDYTYYLPNGLQSTDVEVAFRTRGFFDTDIERWKLNLKKCSFSFGSRFHGNILACNVGVPSVFLRFDRRTNELVDYHKLPNVSYVPKTIKEIIDYIDYSAYYENLDISRSDFNDFLNKNDIPKISYSLY